MDKRKGLINISLGLITQIAILLLNLFTKRKLIDVIGIEASGIIALFNSIFGILSILELGLGSSITFYMYKPIIENDTKKISALYLFYKKIYVFIGGGVILVGLSLTPLIPFLAKEYTLSFNLYIAYIIYIFCSALSFLYSAKLALINAHKMNYIVNITRLIAIITRCGIQILLLLFCNSFYAYISILAISEVVTNILLSIFVKRNYKEIISERNTIDEKTKQKVFKLTKSGFLHKFGFLATNTADNIIISAFIGVELLGIYSNYVVIVNALVTIAQSLFASLSSIIGYAYLQTNKRKLHSYFKTFFLLYYFIASFIFLCFFKCATPFIRFYFDDLILGYDVLLVITINSFIQFMLNAVRLFKDTTDLLYYDRWKCIFESVTNITLSIIFVKLFGISGVLISTIITNLLICNTVEPHVLYKYGFEKKATKFYFSNYLLIAVFVGLLFALHYSLQIDLQNDIFNFLLSGLFATIFSLPSLLILLLHIKKTYGIKLFITSFFGSEKMNKK